MIKLPTNQFLLLVYNLVIADMQQSLAFVLNIHSLREDAIDVGHPTCWAQGWFISTGDLASSLFVLAIAVHTFLAVIKDYKLSQRNLWITIALIWTFNYTMTLAGILHHPTDYYVRAGAWVCFPPLLELEQKANSSSAGSMSTISLDVSGSTTSGYSSACS